MDPIPLLDLRQQFGLLREEILRAIREVIEAQAFILGPTVKQFEEELAQYVGVASTIGCASGTDALILSLAALGVTSGDEVITTPFSFFATASCATKVGARPVFVDISPDTFNLDPDGIEAALTKRTKVILPVHLFGQCAEMDPIRSIARRRGLAIVEDACQSLGATYRSEALGRVLQAGAMGDTGCYSFFPSKNLGGFGDGGAVVTADEALAARLRMLRSHGESERYQHRAIGWNSRLDALQAAVLRVKLPYLDAWSRRRTDNADRYDLLFRESGLLALGRVRTPGRSEGGGHIFNQYTLRVADRDRLGPYLQSQGIGWAVYYPLPLHLQECFRDFGYHEGDFPHAEKAAREAISLPIYPELTSAQQERVVEAVVGFYTRR